ncbi:hypothetical protein B0H14DRAFT_3522840 [Mycena olivaceomarginata]|nr:hypothetical protein B0H14DRAFT_3522840 [Mycena olivaceomarginata]
MIPGSPCGVTAFSVPSISGYCIKKFAADNYKLNTAAHVSQLNRAIIVGVDGGFFVQPKTDAKLRIDNP